MKIFYRTGSWFNKQHWQYLNNPGPRWQLDGGQGEPRVVGLQVVEDRPRGSACPDFSRVDVDVDVVDVLVGADVVVVQIAGHGHSERLLVS